MFSIKNTLKCLLVLGSAVAVQARPSAKVDRRALAARQAAADSGLTDVDILEFALTAEHLESAFYNEGFSKFSASDFTALGLSQDDVDSLLQIGLTEQQHESTLLSAIAGAGAIPVSKCTYNFGLKSAEQMVGIARVLEAVGVSAYLGAAPLVSDPAVLTSAAQIVTVEARHQAFLRVASKMAPVPAPFDTPLGPRAVFSLLAQFVESCPDGSNLNIQPFTTIALANADNIAPGQLLKVGGSGWMPEGSRLCGFVNQAQILFAPIDAADGSCEIPQTLAGEAYMFLTSKESVEDADILAGPSVLSIS